MSTTVVIALLGSTGSIIAIIGFGMKMVTIMSALSEVVKAQLSENGGGSLVDKVNKIPLLTAAVERNHSQAETHWREIEKKIAELKRGDAP